MSRAGFEPTIPEFERAKSVHALDLVATVIGSTITYDSKSKGKLIPVLKYHAMKAYGSEQSASHRDLFMAREVPGGGGTTCRKPNPCSSVDQLVTRHYTD
jgi:hypothetical protein